MFFLCIIGYLLIGIVLISTLEVMHAKEKGCKSIDEYFNGLDIYECIWLGLMWPIGVIFWPLIPISSIIAIAVSKLYKLIWKIGGKND